MLLIMKKIKEYCIKVYNVFKEDLLSTCGLILMVIIGLLSCCAMGYMIINSPCVIPDELKYEIRAGKSLWYTDSYEVIDNGVKIKKNDDKEIIIHGSYIIIER